MEQDIVLTLKNIYDPEIPVNIYDLGLVYEIDVEPDGTANDADGSELSDGGSVARRGQ